MASRGRRGGAPAREDEPRCDERAEQQAPAPQGPVLPPPPPVDYGVFMQGLVQAMQTQAHTQAALQAQLEAQAGGRDGVISGGKESFAEEASSDIPTERQEESSVPDIAAIRDSQQFSGTLCTFPWCEEKVSPLWEDARWYRVLDDYGQVFEVRKQRPQDQRLPKTSAGSSAWSASPSILLFGIRERKAWRAALVQMVGREMFDVFFLLLVEQEEYLVGTMHDVDVVSASTLWTPTLIPASNDADANFSDLHALQSPEFQEQASSPIGELSPMV
ncbi:hypothetical protein Taro_026176 [Colocasia esculenta]|uniref:Uncharacterized protein n=1 Tax=Colocasia esculenta TaxID=4460 RepID=A0A843V5L3_COLES|nr:hypothetical protein [Colocasia esculenta]